jgi:hypothetical protein
MRAVRGGGGVRYEVCLPCLQSPLLGGCSGAGAPQRRAIYTSSLRYHMTYDHRTLKTRLPVRSALFKQRTGELVVRWVTTSEYPLLYVFGFFDSPSIILTLYFFRRQAFYSPCLTYSVQIPFA